MTAEEFMNQKEYEPDSGISFSDYHGDIADSCQVLMVEFAKYHVKKALEQASKDIDQDKLEWIDYYDFSKGVETIENTSNIEAILEAYPESNIK